LGRAFRTETHKTHAC